MSDMVAKSSKIVKIEKLMWLSIVVFAIHNFEEWFTIESWDVGSFNPELTNIYAPNNFGVAVILLTLLYGTLVALCNLTNHKILRIAAMLGFSGIFFNAAMHVVSKVVYLMPMPEGIYSSLFLIIPLGLFIYIETLKLKLLEPATLMFVSLIGALVQFPFAFGALNVARLFTGV